MLSRTAGAPALPIKSEEDLLWEQAVRQHAAGEISDDHLLAVAKATGRADQVRAEIRQKFDQKNAESASKLPAERQASRAANSPAEPDVSEFDTMPGDEPGTRRVWNPTTKQYDTIRTPARTAPEPDPSLGSRWGGGRPFSSQSEQQGYYNRPTLTPEQRQAMVDAGATEEEIADAQASQYDKDARQAGAGTHGGYAPVWINGRVHMLPRAPTPDPNEYKDPANPGVEAGSSDVSAVYDFAQRLRGADVSEQLPIPEGSDGRSVAPGFRPGTANAATGNAATGARADNRDVPPGLRRPDLEKRGYEAVYMEGPNGGEWVYQLSDQARSDARDRTQADRAERSLQRLRVAAGVAGTPEAEGKTPSQLRELIAAKRADEAKAREAMWRPRLMMQRGNAVGALAVPGLNDWQRQFIAGGPTPLTVEAAHNAQLTQLGLQVAQGRGFQQPQMTPEQRQMADVAARKAEEELPAEAAAQRERDRNDGVLPAESSAGRKMLQKIENEVIGFIASQSEIDTAVEEAVRNGIPEADARAYFNRRKNDILFWNPDPYGLRNPQQE